MRPAFKIISEPEPGTLWQQEFERHWPAYTKWFLKEGKSERPSFLECLRALKKHMPEFLPTYEKLCTLTDGKDLPARFLSFYRPPAYAAGCSQAVWMGIEPILVRNYDYDPKLCDQIILDTKWNGRRVIAISDGMCGVVDGMNDTGLAISLAFGGRKARGDGFGIPLILRYILEFCDNTADAVKILQRIPCHMSYNITIVDRTRSVKTVFLSPDREVIVTDRPLATNHQESIEWDRLARAQSSLERETFLRNQLAITGSDPEDFISTFFTPPLYSTDYQSGFATLYTSVYWPDKGQVEYRWPGQVMRFDL